MILRDFALNFNANFLQQKLKRELPKKIQSTLSKASENLQEWLEHLPPSQAKELLSYALDQARPFTDSRGFRISRKSRTHVEIVVPTRIGNKDAEGQLLDEVLIAAGADAFRRCWQENAPQGKFIIRIVGMQWKRLQDMRGQARARFELSDLNRETLLAQLQKNKQAVQTARVMMVDEEDRVFAELELNAEFHLAELLEWK